MNRFYQRYLVEPGKRVNLADYDPDEKLDGFSDKAKLLALLERNNRRLARLQNDLYSENRQSLLIVLQALDAGGKDGTINNVFAAMNPQGCRVQSFPNATPLERRTTFCGGDIRCARTGEVVIFNRSYYEAVLWRRFNQFVSPDESNSAIAPSTTLKSC